MPFMDLHEIEQRELVPGYRARFVHSASMTIAYWDVDAGAVLPEHSHPDEQVANVLEGEFELTVAGEARVLGPGMVVVIPSNVPHSARAVTKCRLLDVFHPVREEYR